mmetsp:Transcript_28819/g.94163  ORF Transcript_28819/g.94163 Transcript_28819/m.94163 type:complete len:248 (+) Transcript_28819:916-1659(+)
MAHTIAVSSTQPSSSASRSERASEASSGRRAILRPSDVSAPSASIASSTWSWRSASVRALGLGASRKSKLSTSSASPRLRLLRCSTTERSDARCTSGGVTFANSSSYTIRGYRRKHFPGAVRPARPARCVACTLLMGSTASVSMPVCASNRRCFTIPGSITKRIPGTVSEVSAMLVATTTRRHPSGFEPKTATCISGGREPYNGSTCMSPHSSSGNAHTRSFNARTARSISSCPVRKTSTSPSPSVM